MKKLAILTSILALAACGGGSGGSGGGAGIGGVPSGPDTPNIPEIPNTSDFTTTSMSDTADNSVEINTYVENILGTDFDSGTSAASVISRHAAVRSGTIQTINNVDTDRNARNQQQIEDMHAFHEKDEAEKREFITNNRQLVKRYAQLAYGNKIEDFDFDNSEIDAILEYLSHDKFKWSHVYDKYKFQKHNLADQELYASGNREWSSDAYIKITQTDNGKITNIKMYDDWFGQELEFTRTQDNKFFATPYTYALRCGEFCQLTFKTGNPQESIENIKAGFTAALEEEAQYNPQITKEEIQAKIDAITADSVFASISATELEGLYDKDVQGLYYTPNQMLVGLDAYGASVGLRYSDFGKISGIQYLESNKADAEKLGYIFAGGYDIKNIDKDTMSGKMAFAGKAVGQVMNHTEDADGVATNNYLDIASDAKLVFEDGKETLTMNFSDWYDVEYVKDGDNIKVSLSNGDKIAEANSQYKFNQSEYRFTKDEYGDWQNFTPDNGNDWGNMQMATMETSYYGDNGAPSEAVGRVGLLDQDWDNSSAENIERFFTASFGATADNK